MSGGSGSEYATFGITGSALGTQLESLLMSDDIAPGSDASYQLCKTIYLYHPLGAKMVELPLNIAQSQKREIAVPSAPEDRVREAFEREWKKMGCDKHIFNVMRLARMYGIGGVVYGAEGYPTDKAIPLEELYKLNLYFNVVDPLNTAGSLVLNQQPNAPDFQKFTNIAVAGQAYHRSRSCVILNEEPIYIAYTTSAFGFVGRSVYQRALFPLKSFIQSMITDDLVTRKAGVLVAMIKQVGSVVDKVMQGLVGIKRAFIKESQTGNVISVGHEDRVESLNLQNTDTAMTTARKNILENIAAAAGMPAQMINNETFAEGFGEGHEDAKAIAQFVDGVRADMQPLYDYFDLLCQYRAWNPEFYKIIQKDFPEYRNVPYKTAFYEWVNSFKAEWPSLLIEPESELIKVDNVKLEGLVSGAGILLPILDPENKAVLVQWIQDNFNDLKLLYKTELILDIEALKDYVPPETEALQAETQAGKDAFDKPPKPKGVTKSDSAEPVPLPPVHPLGNGDTQPTGKLATPGSTAQAIQPIKPGVKVAWK
jgi:hypothetical protein